MGRDVKSKRGDSVKPGDQPSLKMFAINNVTPDPPKDLSVKVLH